MYFDLCMLRLDLVMVVFFPIIVLTYCYKHFRLDRAVIFLNRVCSALVQMVALRFAQSLVSLYRDY